MNEKYHFVKLKRGTEGKCQWFFVPSTVEQVIEHFKTIIRGEISQGMNDYIRGCTKVKDETKEKGYWMYHAHPTTPWGNAVTVMLEIHGGSWLDASVKLENQLIEQRIKTFNKGIDMYLDNGVIETRLMDSDEIIDEKWEDSLIFPIESHVRIEDVRYMQWNMPELKVKGTHWYAKIGNLDIKDENGNMKWDTKEEAEAVAESFVRKLNAKRYDG